MATIKIKQIKSRINCPKVQKNTLDALGLRKMNQVVEKQDTPDILGMVKRVRHLVDVTNAYKQLSIIDLSNLQPAVGSTGKRRRVGRGPGSGMGGTSTRGHKGAKQRSGYSRKIGFEGGQMPLQRRVPKFGCKNINRVEYKAINLSTLEELAAAKNLTSIGVAELIEAGYINGKKLVKILGNGSLTAKLEVKAHAFSKKAEEAIVAAGGTIQKL